VIFQPQHFDPDTFLFSPMPRKRCSTLTGTGLAVIRVRDTMYGDLRRALDIVGGRIIRAGPREDG